MRGLSVYGGFIGGERECESGRRRGKWEGME